MCVCVIKRISQHWEYHVEFSYSRDSLPFNTALLFHRRAMPDNKQGIKY